MDAWTRYLLEMTHCLLLERTTSPKKTDPRDMEIPRKVCSWTAIGSPRPSSRDRGIWRKRLGHQIY